MDGKLCNMWVGVREVTFKIPIVFVLTLQLPLFGEPGLQLSYWGINTFMDHSLYIHIPFCRRRCHYCDFNTYAGMEDRIPAYIDALIKELRIAFASLMDPELSTIYLGGGTPSIVGLSHYTRLFQEIRDFAVLRPDVEISIEANPGTLSLAYLMGLREIGVNRISIGVQSTDTFDLQRLDRIHLVEDILLSLQTARQAGFDNINFDMIFGLPWQNLKSWENSLARALALKPEHFSLYSLIIEPGTLLHSWHQRGLISLQDGDLEADMYEVAMGMLADSGYEHYEISNWAMAEKDRDNRCRHNLRYWRNQSYIGIGAGAHGYVNHIRTANKRQIKDYIQSVEQIGSEVKPLPTAGATDFSEAVDRETQMRDFMVLGFRMVGEGVSQERFQTTYGVGILDVFEEEIAKLLEQGLIEWKDVAQSGLRLSKRGVFLANRVFREFV